MRLPPAWKVKREFIAAYDQIKSLILIFTAPIRRSYYDKRELTAIKSYDGHRALQGKLVLYLIFQPRGLTESTFLAIRYFIAQGHEVLVVSNGLIQHEDIEKLKPLCWRVIERENIGYDFGGYRCGLHYLKNNKIDLEMLSLINDSIWLPLIPDANILTQTEEMNSDFGGAVIFKNKKQKYGNLVLSYWVTLRKSILEAEYFWAYWRKYLPTGNKTLTVKLGERGLSRHMHLAGQHADGVFSTDKFMIAVRSASIQQLALSLKYGSFTDLSFQEECSKLLAAVEFDDRWRISCLDFIERVVHRRNFLHSFCYASIAILGVPFLKKNNLRLQVLMRMKYLEAVYAGDLLSPDACLLKEIEESTDISNQSAAFR